jgi:2-polyprenyl-3-methyl-5-hydroxy-6-metoxy-1,4-benzoquinol methylase
MDVDSREELLLPYITGKKVLDLGAADIRDRSLHFFLCKHAKQVTGIELYAVRAKKLAKKGYDIRVGNAETFSLQERYDVVIAGDLIEHVDNPGMMIDNAMRHLKPGGVFIFNTPNIYSINLLLKGVTLGHVPMFEEHTLGFNEQLLRELLIRRKLRPERVVYFSHKNPRFWSRFIRLCASLRHEWHENIFMVVRKKT